MEVFKRFRPGHKLVISRFEWDIQVPFLQTTDGQGIRLDSVFFSPKQTPDRKWKVSVLDSETQLRICLFHYNSARECVNIDDPILVKMWIPNEKGDKCIQQSLTPSPTIDCVQFQLSKEEIVKSGCQQADGSWTFSFKIFSHAKILRSLCAVDCSGGVCNCLEKLLCDHPFSDVQLKLREKIWYLHKNILCVRSQVFAKMFSDPKYRENVSGLVEIKDDEPEVFEQLLHFLYTGRLDSTTMEKMATNLFILADKYLIDELKSECLKYLLLDMSPKNCVFLLLQGAKFGNLKKPEEYLKKAAKFFRHFPGEVMATDEWNDMKKEDPTLLLNIQEFVYPCK